jgi:hypothetical protein
MDDNADPAMQVFDVPSPTLTLVPSSNASSITLAAGAFNLGLVGISSGRHPIALRNVLDLDEHQIPRAVIGLWPMSRQVMGVVCVSRVTGRCRFARRSGRMHVQYYSLSSSNFQNIRLDHFHNEAHTFVGAGGRWFYIWWNLADYGDHAQELLRTTQALLPAG